MSLDLVNFGDSILNSIYFYINHTLSVARKLSILSPKFSKLGIRFPQVTTIYGIHYHSRHTALRCDVIWGALRLLYPSFR